jgi:transposase
MHPDYGTHAVQINDVLRFAAQHSVKAAAGQFRLHISTVYRWRRVMRHA